MSTDIPLANGPAPARRRSGPTRRVSIVLGALGAATGFWLGLSAPAISPVSSAPPALVTTVTLPSTPAIDPGTTAGQSTTGSATNTDSTPAAQTAVGGQGHHGHDGGHH